MIGCCRKGGTLSVIGVYSLFVDKLPMGVAFNKGLRWVMGQQHGPKYIPRLFDCWQRGKIDPAFPFTHTMPLTEAVRAYQMFLHKQDGCVKIGLRP